MIDYCVLWLRLCGYFAFFVEYPQCWVSMIHDYRVVFFHILYFDKLSNEPFFNQSSFQTFSRIRFRVYIFVVLVSRELPSSWILIGHISAEWQCNQCGENFNRRPFCSVDIYSSAKRFRAACAEENVTCNTTGKNGTWASDYWSVGQHFSWFARIGVVHF